MNKYQIQRINSYIQLSWRLKRIAEEQYECSCGGIYIGAIGADKLSAKRYQMRKGTSYAHSVARVTGSPMTVPPPRGRQIWKVAVRY